MTWISAFLMLCSVAARILLFCEEGADSSVELWFQILLPAAAGILFILMILLDGEQHFYRTAIPIWIFAICFAQLATVLIPYWRYILLIWILYGVLAGFYTRVTAGKVKNFWLLWFVAAGLLTFFVAEKRHSLPPQSLTAWYWTTQNALMAASFLAVSLAIQIRPDGYPYCPTWGDRADGRRVRTISAMSYVVPYIMPQRNDACNWIHNTLELSAVERYVRAKRLQGLSGFGITHVFLAAYARTAAQYPAINRFCSGQHVYSRDRNLEFVMTVKTKMSNDAPDTTIKVYFDPADTPEDIYRKLNTKIEEVKDAPLDSDFDKTAKALTFLPGLVFTFVVKVLRTMDYFGLLPRFLLRVSPFHGSVIFTSMGSLGIPPVVHHLYNFGNLPIFFALGCKYKKTEVQPDGTVVTRKYVDFTVNTDERIVDGFYFASCLKYMRMLLAHPERLDTPPAEVLCDIP